MGIKVSDSAGFKAALNSLSVRQLIVAMRHMNGGRPLGYDYSKRTKADLQEHAERLAFNYASSTGVSTFSKLWESVEKALTDDERVDLLETSEGSAMRGEIAGAKDSDNQGGGDGDSDTRGEQSEMHGGAQGGNGTDEKDGPEGEDKGEEGKSGGKEGKEGEKDGKPEKGKGKPKQAKEPTTPEEKLAAALKQVLGQEDKPEVDEEMLERLIQKEMEKRANVYKVQVQKPDSLTPDFEDSEAPRHAAFKEVLEAVAAGLNVLLVGPAGCGKSVMGEHVARALGLKFRFTGAVASEYKLLGFITAQGAPVRTEYREAYEHGAVFMWDELDASSPQAMLSFNAGLANGHQDFPDAIVTKHADFRAIASANTYGNGADRQYVGRNQLDAASLDRFYVIPMDYDEELERSLYGNGEWVRYIQKARKATRKLNIRHVVSMRAIDMGLRMLKSKVSRGDVERAVLWKHMNGDDIKKVKAEIFGAAV